MKRVLSCAHFLCLALMFPAAKSYAQPHVLDWASAISTKEGYGTNLYAVTTDPEGNVYATGAFMGSMDFDPGSGVLEIGTINSGIDENAFVVKLNAQGQLLWARCFIGEGISVGRGISVDKEGSVYTTGYFTAWGSGMDFDPGADTTSLLTAGLLDPYVSKLDANGNFVWVAQFASPDFGFNMGQDIMVDDTGHVYVTGTFFGSMDFDPTAAGTYLLSGDPYEANAFTCKLDAANGHLKWAVQVEGTSPSHGTAIVYDPAGGTVYMTGRFGGTHDFDPGSGSHTMTANGSEAGFILRMDTLGDFVWVKQVGGVSLSSSNMLAIHDATLKDGRMYMTGKFQGTVDFDPGTGVQDITSAVGKWGCFALCLDTAGSFVWDGHIGGDNDNYGQALATDRHGNVYITGTFLGNTDLDPSLSGTFNLTSGHATMHDIFIAKLRPDGSFAWGSQFGRHAGGDELSIDVAPSGDIYTAGQFFGTADFDPGPGTVNLSTIGGSTGVFFSKLRCNDTTSSSITDSACTSYTLNDVVYTSSGRYEQRFTGVSGCDSVVRLDITILRPDAVIVKQPDGTLRAGIADAIYQWIDCEDNSPISGATDQNFTPEVNKSYAVIATKNGCSDTSECITATTGIEIAGNAAAYVLSPNPAVGTVILTTDAYINQGAAMLTNNLGQIVWQQMDLNGRQFVFDISGLSPGIYFMEVANGNDRFKTKLVKY